jgi:hypothetical protein
VGPLRSLERGREWQDMIAEQAFRRGHTTPSQSLERGRRERDVTHKKALFWFALCWSLPLNYRCYKLLRDILDILGMMAGFVALISLVVENWGNSSSKLHTVTLVFGIPAGLCIAAIIHGLCSGEGSPIEAAIEFRVLLPGFLVLLVVYADWALGAMAENLVGLTSSDSALYWLYFGLKRFTMVTGV